MSAIKLGTNRADSRRSLLRWFSPTPQPKPTAPKPAAVPVQPRGKKILIVDDDAIVVKTTAMKLAAEGYGVVTATEGAEAIRAARREKPDLILLDLNFPSDVGTVHWDGFLIMSWLRRLEEARQIPIVIITSGEAVKNQQRSITAGATAFFNKPIAHESLLSVIDRAIGPEAAKRSSRPTGDFQI